MDEIDRLLRCHHSSEPVVIEVLVKTYRVPIYRLALSILCDPDEAEDALQETLIAATVKLDSYRAGTNFRAWIYTIAINQCRGILRKRSARLALARLAGSMETASGSQAGPEAIAIQHDTRTRLWQMVDRLPEKQRLVVILRLAHELSIAEIAQALGIPSKTVYTRLRDAMHTLRGQLAREADVDMSWKELFS